MAQVMESWRLVLSNDGFDSIQLEDVRVHATGSLVRVLAPLSAGQRRISPSYAPCLPFMMLSCRIVVHVSE